MDKSVDKLPGERIGEVVRDRDLDATEIAKRLRVNYTGLSHFHRGRRASLPGRVQIPVYLDLLESLTGETAESLGLADLRAEVAA